MTAVETQNITLSLPKSTLLKVRLLAVQRGTSVSGLLASELEKLVAQALGQIDVSRDDLHER